MHELKKAGYSLIFTVLFLAVCFFIWWQVDTLQAKQSNFSMTADEIRTMQFGWGSGWDIDDVYRLTIPDDYLSCAIKLTSKEWCYSTIDGSDGPSEDLLTSVEGGAYSSADRIIYVDPGEVWDIRFESTGDLYCNPTYYNTVYWDYNIYKYGYCGDGRCGTASGQVGVCDNNQIITEDCSTCPADCGSCAPTLKEDGESCSLDSECEGEYCVHNICRAWPFYFGDGYCDSDEGEACSDPSVPDLCSPDCTPTSSGTAADGADCSSSADCQSSYCYHGVCCDDGLWCCQKDTDCQEGNYCDSSIYACREKGTSDVHNCTEWRQCQDGYCVHGICRAAAYYCGDGSCDADYEDCNSCSSDCGVCATQETTTEETTTQETTPTETTTAQETTTEPEVEVSEFDNLSVEYHNIFNYLEKKIDVAELKQLDVSPADMHDAIEALAEGYESNADKQKGIELLKAAIGAEELGIAVYEAEEEMAEIIAESSWQSLKAYLFYKIKLIIEQRLSALADSPEMGDLIGELKQTAEAAAKSYSSGEPISDDELTEVLNKLGITDDSQIKQIIDATNSAFAQAAGGIKRYLDAIESAVHNKYVEVYKNMFIANFEEAISNQVVYYQAGLYYHTEHLNNIKNGQTPYSQYRDKITAMQTELAKHKDFVLGEDNVFDKCKNANQKFINASEEFGKFLDGASMAGQAVDTGAGLANMDTHLGDVIDKVKEYNDDLNSALQAASDVVDLAGKFAESLFGTYQEAKVYSIFFNAYSDWCDTTMGDCVAVLRIPGTDLKVDVEAVYELGRTAGAAVDAVGSAAGDLAYALADSLESLVNDTFTAFSQTAQTAKVKLKEGEKVVKESVFSAVAGAKNRVSALASWGSSWFSYNNLLDYSIIKQALAAGNTEIELTLISPTDERYGGTVTPDGLGAYVVVDNPESGTWKTELVGKKIDGTKEVSIALNVDQIKPGETRETLPGHKKTSDDTWQMYLLVIGGVAVVVLIGWGIVRLIARFVRKKKGKDKSFTDKIKPDKGAGRKRKNGIIIIIIAVTLFVALAAAFAIDWYQDNRSNENINSGNLTNTTTVNSQQDNCQDIDLSKELSKYYYTKDDYTCENYLDEINSDKISTRCDTTNGRFRKHFVREIDVSDHDQVNIKANLSLTEHEKLFTMECSGVGVKYDKYVRLVIMSTNPNGDLASACNKKVSGDDWQKCSIDTDEEGAIGSCYVDKCSTAATCDIDVDVKDYDSIYAVFVVADAWNTADVEGSVSNLQICEQ